jgi:tetratricopeptide (TPR) repeat protein
MSVLFVLTGFLANAYRTARYNRAESHFALGNRLAQERQDQQAAEEYRAALSFSPNSPRYRLALALSLLDLGRLEEAEAHLFELRESDPASGVINLALARIAAGRRNWEEAVLCYHRAIYGFWPEQPEKNRVQARLELIGLLAKQSRQKDVIGELLVLAGDAPGDLSLQKRAAEMLLANESPRHAGEIFQNVLETSPGDAAAWRGQGEAQFALGDYPAAHRSFQHALRLDQSDQEARRRLAECDQILALDPTLPKLSSTQRYERVRQVVSRILQGLEQCAASCGGSPPDETLALGKAAHTLLDARMSRHVEGATPQALTLAQELWKSWNGLCSAAAHADEPLSIIIGKVSK